MAVIEKRKLKVAAVWTRFNPVLLEIQKALHDGVIGDVRCLYSDLSMRSAYTKPDSHRLLSAEMAGGPLLDLGPYPLVWVSLETTHVDDADDKVLMMLYHHPKNEKTPPAKVGSTMLLHTTGVDISTSFSMTFPKIGAMAFCG